MTVKTFRADAQVEEALEYLGTLPGAGSRSDIIRSSVLEAARRKRSEMMRAEAEALRTDPDYLAEVAAVRSEMDLISAW